MMILQSGGGRNEEGVRLGSRREEEDVKSDSEISKGMDEIVSRINELKFLEDGSENIDETLNFVSESVSHFEDVAVSLLNEISGFLKYSTENDGTEIIDEKILERSSEFLQGGEKHHILSSKSRLCEYLSESRKTQSAFEQAHRQLESVLTEISTRKLGGGKKIKEDNHGTDETEQQQKNQHPTTTTTTA
jgi:hypothetical protein